MAVLVTLSPAPWQMPSVGWLNQNIFSALSSLAWSTIVPAAAGVTKPSAVDRGPKVGSPGGFQGSLYLRIKVVGVAGVVFLLFLPLMRVKVGTGSQLLTLRVRWGEQR